jgi:Fe-Mn family superoxide dismutase
MKNQNAFDNEIKEGIREALGIKGSSGNSTKSASPISTESSVISEAYVVQAKTFNLPTEFLSQKNKKAHQELLSGYVKALNTISAELDTADRENSNPNDSSYRNLKVDEVHNLNAAFLHGLFFENISDLQSQLTMDSIVYMRLERDFGSFDAWQKDFIACAMASRNGWAVTVYNTFLNRYLNVCVDLHNTNIPFGSYPVVVLDCWEHSYYSDYLNDRKTYVFAMMKELDWEKIEKRFEKAEKISKVSK